MEEFNQQLGAVESEMTGTVSEFPDMDPEAKRECQERLNKTVETLLKIQKDLMEADKADPDARVVRVLRMETHWKATTGDFVRSFEDTRISGSIPDAKQASFIKPDAIQLFMEKNYRLDQSGKVLPGAVDQWYLKFGSEKEARHALSLQSFCLQTFDLQTNQPRNKCGNLVQFAKPVQTFAVRATFRKIGPLIERITEIQNELQGMGAVYDCGEYKPDPNKYIDKAWFTACISGLKRTREAGMSLDHNAYGPLKHRKPIDTAAFMARVKKLYNEECDCLIALREFQLNGVEFDF
jgi:hypothetical protein